MTSSRWCQFLLEAGIFQTGSFRLKSGKSSPYFLNFGKADQGRWLAQLGDFFAQALVDQHIEPDLLFGPAYKGLPLALATTLAYYQKTGRSLAWGSFRKESKDHGDSGLSLGRPPWPGCRFVLIDDVLTTSQTKLECLEQIQAFLGEAPPARCLAVLVGVDREEPAPQGGLWAEAFEAQTGIPVLALTRMQDLLEELSSSLPPEVHQACLDHFHSR